MGTPFLAEIKLVSFNFPPRGWAFANGQFLPINQNQALFSLLGTTYGGNGQTNFALPNLQTRAAMHRSNVHVQGEMSGAASVTLNLGQMPTHTHFMQVSTNDPDSTVPGPTAPVAAIPNGYRQPESLVALTPATIDTVGGGQAHNNLQPYLGLTMIIALQGVFPSRN